MVTSGAITQRLDRLEELSLVTRGPNEDDGRVVDVELTTRGRTLIDAVLADHVETGERLLEGLTSKQRSALGDSLRRLLESLGDTVDAGAFPRGG